MHLPATFGPAVASVGFILSCVACAMPIASITRDVLGVEYSVSYGIIQSCISIGGVSTCTTETATGCDQADAMRKAIAAFSILVSVVFFSTAAFGVARAFMPAFNQGFFKLCFAIGCGVTAVFALIAGSIGAASFTGKYCGASQSTSDVEGSSIGANVILNFVVIAFAAGAAIVDLIMNKGSSSNSANDDHFAPKQDQHQMGAAVSSTSTSYQKADQNGNINTLML